MKKSPLSAERQSQIIAHIQAAGHPDFRLDAKHPYEQLSGGVSRQTYKLNGSEDRQPKQYVVSIGVTHRVIKPSTIQAIQTHMADCGIAVPRPVGGFGTLKSGEPFEVTEAITNAKPLRQPTTEQAGILGEMLAKVHLAGDAIIDNLDFARNPVLPAPAIQLARHTVGKAITVFRAFGHDVDWTEVARRGMNINLNRGVHSHLPIGLIHGDVHVDNVLEDAKGGLHLIDWELSHKGNYLTDICSAMLRICHRRDTHGTLHFSTDTANALLEGYQAVRPLTRAEQTSLPTMLSEKNETYRQIRQIKLNHTRADTDLFKAEVEDFISKELNSAVKRYAQPRTKQHMQAPSR